MSSQVQTALTFDEYLTLDREADVRNSDQRWLLTEYKELHETAQPTAINCQLKLTDIYNKWELLYGAT